jgi:hypothetical protein
VVIDILASVFLVLLAIGVALYVTATAIQYQALPVTNGGALVAVTYGMIGIAVLASFLAFGFVVVGLIRRRYTFLWPLAAIVVMIATTWIATAILGGLLP